VFLAYVLMPYHSRLRREVTGPVSIVILAGAAAGMLVAAALVVYSSVIGLNEQLPGLQARAVALAHGADEWVTANVPWVYGGSGYGKRAEARLAEQAAQAARPVLNAAGEALLEACVVGLYLVFLLLEASRFPARVRKAYPAERAEEILHVAGQVNAAIVGYLRAKVKSSLLLAVPVGLALWAFGVRFAFLWAVLTFLCNFIPYIGSVVAYCLPVGFAFLQLDLDWRPVAVAAVLLGCHIGSASVVEPMVIGRAVGLSPLVILGSLAFWGLLWGIPGMFLAVPLTVVAVIVMGHFKFTRPVAQLVGG
jgi:AI-2 transport protein TqsA